jgi:hypothetical protein
MKAWAVTWWTPPNLIGNRHSAPLEYRFEDLHAAFSEYLAAVVAMLDKLSKVDILRR